MTELEQKELVIIDEESIKDLIYEIRGEKVMLDFDLARIYGYETFMFNRQVRRNIERFPPDFMFQLTKEEANQLSTCQFGISIPLMQKDGAHGGRTKLPYAFTEQGIYCLMSVLKGELAIKQTIALVRLFKKMKDYIIEQHSNLPVLDPISELTEIVYQNKSDIVEIKETLSGIIGGFSDVESDRYIFLPNQRIEADNKIQEIIAKAKESIIIVDNYIGIKTLEHLKACQNKITVYIFSDNVSREKVTDKMLEDYKLDTGNEIVIKPQNKLFHDRYIVIDYKTDNELFYNCGPSIKDVGGSVGTIEKENDAFVYHSIIDKYLFDNEEK